MPYPTPAQSRLDAFIAATCLIPAVVLDGVIEEIHQIVKAGPLADRLYTALRNASTLDSIEAKTGHAFEHLDTFKTAVSVPDPRPAYYAQMRLWVASEIKCHFPSVYHTLPAPFRKIRQA